MYSSFWDGDIFRHVSRVVQKPPSLPSELVGSDADSGAGVADAGAFVGAGTGEGVVGTGASDASVVGTGAEAGASVPAAASKHNGGR